MAISPVQTVTGTAATSATSVAVTITGVAAGNTLVFIGSGNGITSASVTSVTDSAGNTINLMAAKNPVSSSVAQAGYILNASAGSHTITVNWSGSASAGGSMVIREYRQFDFYSFDQHIEHTGSTDNPMTSTASPTTTQAYENVVCWCCRLGSTAPTVGTGFGNFTVVNGPSNNCQSVLEDMTVIAKGTQTGLVNDSAATSYACGVMTFKSKLIQTPSGTGASSSVSVTMDATAAGNFLVIGWTTAVATSESISSVVDSAGNNWTNAYSQTDVTGNASGVYYLPSASNLGGITSVTITFGQAQSGCLAQVREYTSLQNPVTALDKTTHQLSSANPATSGASASTTVNTELVLGVANTLNASANPNWSAGTGYSNFVESLFNFGGPVFIYLGMEEKEVSATGAQTATFVNAGLASTATVVVTFKEVGSSQEGSYLSIIGSGS